MRDNWQLSLKWTIIAIDNCNALSSLALKFIKPEEEYESFYYFTVQVMSFTLSRHSCLVLSIYKEIDVFLLESIITMML